jgi:oxygen-independent coproporphyrinogen-3 oxidase
VYFGGGTPTVLNEHDAARILRVIKNNYTMCRDAEITIEANPDTVPGGKLANLRRAGFNRLSVGVQTFDDNMLGKLGRTHTAEAAERVFAKARAAGFDNVGIDLMFALPSQTEDGWEADLMKAVSFSPEHISCYSLSVEDGTSLSKQSGLGLPDEETDRRMYRKAKEILVENGYEHYEISNFAKPGYQSRHNNTYWTHGEYIGFGLGAHSFLEDTRFHNLTDLEGYTARDFTGGYVRVNEQAVSGRGLISEFMILGLRMADGVSVAGFKRRFGRDIDELYPSQITKLLDGGLIVREGGLIRLTELGMDLANRVMAEFI